MRLAVIAPLVAASDALENLTSFAMRAAPRSFPDVLALVYSGFSAIKWAWSGVGTSLLVVQLVALLLARRTGERGGTAR